MYPAPHLPIRTAASPREGLREFRMSLTFDPFDAGRRRIRISIPASIHARLRMLQEKLERRFRIRLGDDELIDYMCEKALERVEEWERRTGCG